MPVAEKRGIRFGPFELDLHSGELRKNGTRLRLQPQPIEILSVLLEHPGELVTREELRKRLWPEDTFVDFEQGLNTAIKKLRQALCDEAETPRYIETLPRRGYRFIAEVSPGMKASELVIRGPTPEPAAPRHPSLRIGLFTLAAGVLVIAGAAYSMFWRPELPRIVAVHRLTQTPYKKSLEVLTDGSRVYFGELRNNKFVLSQVAASGGEVTRVPIPTRVGAAVLRDIAPDGSVLLVADIQREGEPNWVVPLPVGPARPLPQKMGGWLRFTEDGRSILHTGTSGNDLYISSINGDHSQLLFRVPINIERPRISPAGDRIRFTSLSSGRPYFVWVSELPLSEPDIWEVGIDGRNLHRLLGEKARGNICGDWSKDGRLFVFSHFDGATWNLWALREGERWFQRKASGPVQLTFGPHQIAGAAISRDGKKLYAVVRDLRGELTAYQQNSGESQPYIKGISASFVDFSRDGQWVTYVEYPQGTLWRSRIDGSDRMQLTSLVPQAFLIYPRWSPDGKLIVYSDLNSRRLYMVPAQGGEPMLLVAGDFVPTDPSWFPDGKRIAYGGCAYGSCGERSEVRVFDVETRRSTAIVGSQGMFAPRVSLDGKYMVAQSDDQRSLWLFAFGEQRWVKLVEGPHSFGYALWSGESKYIYANREDENIVRIRISDHRVENVLQLKDIPLTGWWDGGWFGLTPDEKIIMLRNTSSEDVYAFDLEYH